MRALLGETFGLLGTHLHLFTLLALTVWLPGHVLLNYLEFFDPGAAAPGRSLRIVLAIQVVFDPLVVSATLAALARIKQGLPVGYGLALAEGAAAWSRLLFVRFLINCVVALPAVGGLALSRSGGAVVLVAGGLLLALSVLILAMLVRVAVVDSVVVLEGGNAVTAWGRAAALTAGQRWPILWTAAVLFALVFSSAMLLGQALRAAPGLNHFVVRVLVDSALAVSQSLFTIAFFLFYWRARQAAAASAPA